MEITHLTLDFGSMEKRKRNPKNKIYSRHLFSRGKKIVEITLPAWSYSRVTQPIQNPSTPEYCLLIEKLPNLKLKEFPTLLKEVHPPKAPKIIPNRDHHNPKQNYFSLTSKERTSTKQKPTQQGSIAL